MRAVYTLLLFFVGVTNVVAAPVRVNVPGGYYVVARPGNVPETAAIPLIFCLHGAEEDAAKAVSGWQEAQGDLPYVVVAPQCPSNSWSAADVDYINAVFAHVTRTVDHDPQRILLAGHGAGAAIAAQLFYERTFPAVGLALHGGAMPATTSMPQLIARLDRHVLWTIGDRDPNASTAAAGAERLRVAGLSVDVRRGPAGATPGPAVLDLAARWFDGRCADAVARFSKEITAGNLAKEPIGDALMSMEELVTGSNLLPLAQAQQLARVRADIETPPRQVFLKVNEEAQNNKPLEARALLLDLERRFLPSPLGMQALHRRSQLETTTSLSRMLKPGTRAADVSPAAVLWMRVESAKRRGRLPEAYRICRQILQDEPNSAEADRAESLLLEMDPDMPRRPKPTPSPTPVATPVATQAPVASPTPVASPDPSARPVDGAAPSPSGSPAAATPSPLPSPLPSPTAAP